ILRDENRRVLKKSGTAVDLMVTPEEALARIGDAAGRPLLAADAAGMAPRILEARLSLYRAAADIVVDTVGRTVDEVVEGLVTVLGDVQEIVVSTAGSGRYPVVLGCGVLRDLGARMSAALGQAKTVVATDENVARLHLETAMRSLADAGVDATSVVAPPGESSKNWETAGRLLDRFAEAGLDRRGCVVALGGGVVGDLAGFAAATYMRGVSLVQAPTTLLAQVDSSIGGKTGVDLRAGKNLAGAFWQPAMVVSDIAALATLPDAEWSNGLVEAAKSALLAGETQTAALEKTAPRLVVRDAVATRAAIEASVRFKADVVAADAREEGPRECLNFGHTLGHALEAVIGYGVVSHGVAVAEGMRFAARLAEEIIGAPSSTTSRVAGLLDALAVPRLATRPSSAEELMQAMRIDKKARGGAVRFVLLRDPGDWVVVPVEGGALRDALERWVDE
ncbi:MAG: 3-dehydroquinate synthase, partial [Coriobacteriales bacterium]